MVFWKSEIRYLSPSSIMWGLILKHNITKIINDPSLEFREILDVALAWIAVWTY